MVARECTTAMEGSAGAHGEDQEMRSLRSVEERERAQRAVWVVAPAGATEAILQTARSVGFDPSVSVYQVSSLGRYLLCPRNIEVQRRLVGCEIVFEPTLGDRINRKFSRLLPRFLRGRGTEQGPVTEQVLSLFDPRLPQLRDSRLRDHILEIYAGFRQDDQVIKRLASLPLERVGSIVGICIDQAGNRSRMQIEGTVEDQVAYMEQSLLKDVIVILDSAHLGRGLFEMGGFDLAAYDPERRFCLISGQRAGRRQACVLQGGSGVDYWVQDPKLVDYLFLLEHALRSNAQFREPFEACIAGEAIPLKLLFNRELDIRYSGAHPPEAYREVLPAGIDDQRSLDMVFDAINRLQLGVSLNYIPLIGDHGEQMFTNISVMHDMRALEPIKERLPKLYAAMAARASSTDVGSYYVLDSIKGSRHDL